MKKSLSALLLAAGSLFGHCTASAAVVVSFVPSATQVAVGDTVSVDMNIAGLDAEILSAFDIDAVFNGSVLGNTAVSFLDAQFGGAADSFFVSTSGGNLTDAAGGSFLDDAALAAQQADSFTMLRFSFTGLADGASIVSLGSAPDFARNFVGRDAQSLAVQVGSVCIAVGNGSCDTNAVPEPDAIGLGMLALVGALTSRVWRRGRRRETS